MRIAGTIVSVAIGYLVATGCYHPTLRDCAVECSAPTECAGDQICREGWCTGSDADACTAPATTPDAGTPAVDAAVDSALPDPLCALGCTNGTCDSGGVCVIDCSVTGSCDEADVRCPANVPCRVVCGDGACAKKVICGSASSCDVRCVGTSSCADEIQCGAAACEVTCSGSASCHKRVKCSASCSCDVRCTGSGSCAETPECPMDRSCELGRGCSAALPGCDTCAP